MPRPKSKEELIHLSNANYTRLMELVEAQTEEVQLSEFPTGTMNRNIRDVLAHLYHWHGMMLDWYNVGMDGNKPEMPAKGYTWKTVPVLNAWIFERYSTYDLQEVKQLFAQSHAEVCALIAKHSNDELFEKKRYKWTGTTSLGSYLVSATSSHYDWAYKLIRKALKKNNVLA